MQNARSDRRCAYCGDDAPLTREHLWPAAIIRQVMSAEGAKKHYWFSRFDKPFSSEPTVKDVCAKCNNGYLSVLDKYGSALFESTFSKRLEKDQKVVFTFDYHLLKRWLLKLSYNAARINGSVDAFAFEPLLPYIRDGDLLVGKSVQLYVQLAYPGRIPKDLLEKFPETPPLYYPVANRVGHVVALDELGRRRLMRAVHLHAYTFVLALFELKAGSRERNETADVALNSLTGSRLLRHSRSAETLTCDGADAWESLKSSRNFRLPNARDK